MHHLDLVNGTFRNDKRMVYEIERHEAEKIKLVK